MNLAAPTKLSWGIQGPEPVSAESAKRKRLAAERAIFTILATPPATADGGSYLTRLRDLIGQVGEPQGVDIAPGSPTRGSPALHLVARYHTSARVGRQAAEMLLGAGANPDALDAGGETAVHVAVQLGNVEVLETLLAAGADPNRRSHAATATAIDMVVEAMRYPDCEIRADTALIMLRALVTAGAKVEDARNGRPDPLLLAAGGNDHGRQGDLHEAVEILLQAGADVHRREAATGRAAIHYAFLRGYWRTASLLFLAGADPYTRDRVEYVPADYAESGMDAQHELRAVLRGAEMRLLRRAQQAPAPRIAAAA